MANNMFTPITPPSAPAGWNFRGETNINNKYSALSGFQNAFNQVFQHGVSLHSDSEGARQRAGQGLSDMADQFSQQFTNMVGRAPNQDELNSFLGSQAGNIFVNSANGGQPGTDSNNVRNQIVQYVGDTGQQAAKDYATQQLQAQQGQANDLASLFRTQGKQAISQTENSLLDYQQRLFERLRPNLITSLQSQGLLNTGGFNEAMAGQQADLANEGAKYVADLNLQNEQGANQIAYGGAAAPYQFQQQQIMQQPGQMQQMGTDALNKAFQTSMSNLDFNHQAQLMNLQGQIARDNQPSFLRTLGQSAATSLGSNLNGPAWMSAASNGTKTATVASSRSMKHDISKLSNEQEEQLYDRLVQMPLSVWKYNGSETPHLGVITDEAIPQIVMPDGAHLSVVDYLGVLTLALKVQHRRYNKEVA